MEKLLFLLSQIEPFVYTIIGAILSYIFYALYQSCQIKRQAEIIFKRLQICDEIFFYEKMLNKKVDEIIQLKNNFHLMCGFDSIKIKKYLDILQKEQQMIMVVNEWIKYKSGVMYKEQFNGNVPPIQYLKDNNIQHKTIEYYKIGVYSRVKVGCINNLTLKFKNKHEETEFECYIKGYGLKITYK